MLILSDFKPKANDFLLKFYKFSRSINIAEILSFGLIFYGLSIFLNRPSSVNGIFGSMENITGITQEAWAVIIVFAVISVRINLNPVLQISGIIGLVLVMLFMWVTVWKAGLAWQGVMTYSLCVLVGVKTSVDDIVEHILIKQGKL